MVILPNMSRIFLIALLAGLSTAAIAQPTGKPTGRDIVKKMHDRYAGKWYRFRNGKLRSTTIDNNEGIIFLLGGMFFYPLGQTEKTFDPSNLVRSH